MPLWAVLQQKINYTHPLVDGTRTLKETDTHQLNHPISNWKSGEMLPCSGDPQPTPWVIPINSIIVNITLYSQINTNLIQSTKELLDIKPEWKTKDKNNYNSNISPPITRRTSKSKNITGIISQVQTNLTNERQETQTNLKTTPPP